MMFGGLGGEENSEKGWGGGERMRENIKQGD